MTQNDQRNDNQSPEPIRDLSGDAPSQAHEAERRKAVRKLLLRFASKRP